MASAANTPVPPENGPAVPAGGIHRRPAPVDQKSTQDSGTAAADTPDLEVSGVTKKPRISEIGTTGLKQSYGYVQEEFLKELRGDKSAKFYREMSDNSAIVGGLVLGYQQVATHLDWTIEEPEEATDRDVAATKFVREAFEDIDQTWDSVLLQALSQIVYGWSFHEVVYKRRDDGRVGWAKFPIRAQESLDHWEIDEHGDIRGMIQRDPTNGRTYKLPMSKGLLFRTNDLKNNPEGRSMLRPAVVAYQYLRRIQEYEAIGIERDLAGLPVAWVPEEWFSGDNPQAQASLAKMVKMVQDVRNNERAGLVLPMIYHEQLTDQLDHNKMFDFELLSSSGGKQFDTDKVITRYNQQIAMALLGDFVTLGHEGVGSYAVGTVKMDLWVMVVDSLCRGIARTFSRGAIQKLLELNGIAFDHLPELSYGKVTNVDLAALVAYVSGLANAGILTPDEGTEAWLREQGGMPPLDPEVEPIYDRAPVNPMTGLPMDPENPVDVKTGLPVDPDTHGPKGLADPTKRTAEAQAAAAEHAAKNPAKDPNDPKIIGAKAQAAAAAARQAAKKPGAAKPKPKA